ncbi:MAG: uroporphyrinogen decarboxylase family protein [Caldilineaceae bacterium]
MSSTTPHWERIHGALAGAEVDRIPVSFWRHFPGEDETPEGLAAATLRWQTTFDFDLVKFMPTGTYGVHDWGAETEYGPPSGGTRVVVKFGVTSPEQWTKLPVLDPAKGALGREVEAIRLAAAWLNRSAPLFQTVFSPLTTARKLAGDRIFADLNENPDLLKAGLQAITDTTVAFVRANLAAGSDGIFFASQCSSSKLVTEDQYREFGAFFDTQVANAVRQEGKLTLLHIHGEDIFFDLLAQYDVDLINWHDRLTWPNLREAQARFKGVTVGGVRERQTLIDGSAEDIRREVESAVDQTGGRRLIIGPGCVIPTTTPVANVCAVLSAVNQRAFQV